MIVGYFVAAASPSTYTFSGAPSAPLPAAGVLAGWDIQVHSRDSSTWYQMEGMSAQHGADCSAPPATHELVGRYQDAVFQCKDHIMTAITASGYGVIYLTPNQMLDVGSGGTVSFELSTERMSIRDWADLWITPYEDNLALPFDDGDVDLQGVPRQGVHIQMSQFNGGTTFRGYTIKNFVETEVDDCWWCEIGDALNYTPTGQQRETFRLTLSKTHMKFEMVASATAKNVVWVDTAIPALDFSQGVVQFGHHSYNPAKDNSGVAATWHWDNVTIDPAVPFNITRGDRRYVDAADQVVSFGQGAPAGASLRFAANGDQVELSTDGGATWSAARIQPAQKVTDKMQNYFTSIPAGTTSVRLRGKATFMGPFFAQDFAVWAKSGGSSIPTSTATPTRTPIPGATPTPTNTPTQTVTLTGSISVEGRSSAAGVTVSVQPGGASAQTAADGSFTISGLPANATYTLQASLPGFLTARLASLKTTSGTTIVPATTLRAGDADGDGSVTIIDVSLVAGLFGLAPGNIAADLNASGIVDIVDVSLTAANFGLTGPTNW